MAKDQDRSAQLKADGNTHFQSGDFIGAESLYSKAIIADDANPALYTNRAMARLKLELWDSAIADCQACLKLTDTNMKAYFILSQAQLPLHDYDGALDNALKAHRLCAESNDRSLPHVTAQVLRCKKERWDDMERRRARQGQELEADVLALMRRERDENITSCESEVEREQIQEEWDGKMKLLKQTFEMARPDAQKTRTVPDWAIDDISFGIMVDPVITKTGKSYERASIMEHLRRHETDPLTRETLHPRDLRPNLDLKQACEEFLEQNGWAVDW